MAVGGNSWQLRAAHGLPGGLAAGHGQSDLDARVLQLWAWGTVSPQTVPIIKQVVVLDGLVQPVVVAMSKIGFEGRHTQSVQRDIIRLPRGDVQICD